MGMRKDNERNSHANHPSQGDALSEVHRGGITGVGPPRGVEAVEFEAYMKKRLIIKRPKMNGDEDHDEGEGLNCDSGWTQRTVRMLARVIYFDHLVGMAG